MNNQWGRSGNGSAAGGGSGIGGILFASVVSLALGAAGGYGAFRMMDGATPSGEIEQRDQRIADLARELDARVAQIEESTQKAQTLSEENGALKRQVETLGKCADTSKAADTSEATVALAENAKLTQEIVPGLKNDLELSRQRVADAEALQKRAEDAKRDRDRQLSLSMDEIARLKKTLEETRNQQQTTRSAEAERLGAEAEDLRAQLKQAQSAADTLRKQDVPALRVEIARRDQTISELNARNAALTKRIGALETAARAVQPSRPEEDDGDKPTLDNAGPPEGRSPRNAALVAEAMRDTPGLDRLTSVQRDQLERTLLSGECVTNALGNVFKRVPVLTLRNMMRDLDSDC